MASVSAASGERPVEQNEEGEVVESVEGREPTVGDLGVGELELANPSSAGREDEAMKDQ